MANWQQVFALDAKYNAYRAPNNPQFRTLYIKRRSQLLRESASNPEKDSSARKDYLQLRARLLSAKYGSPAFSDQGSIKSRSFSFGGRSISKSTLESMDPKLGDTRKFHRRQRSSGSAKFNLDGPMKRIYDSIELVPTKEAEASRAMAGGMTVSENYAFAGMHHIFDQHTDADFAWSLSNDIILSVSFDGTARLWKVASGECIRTIRDITGAELHSCLFHPLNNNMFVTGNSKCFVQVINVSTGKGYKGGSCKITGQALSLAFDPTGATLWVGDDKGSLSSFNVDLAHGKLIRTRRVLVCEGHSITSISARAWVSREAREPSLLVNCAINSLCLFRICPDGSLQLKKRFSIRQKHAHVRSTFCPLMSFRQGACVISGSEDMCVYFFDIGKDKKACVNKLLGHSAPVLDVCFNCDESLLASCDAQGLVIIWKREGKQGVL
ncbi:WD repeat-containing protein 13-like isoform X3 [Dreissena polymorpha]|uniref:WD repeat-containing protein 13-like isoform X3 n=1 Tax=Dreissena polymorpha TaxID=45954 RepID=UPI002264D3C9|nr:WD repeat-containing protein 13-like isoform X3 [Dreissena polymorpha]